MRSFAKGQNGRWRWERRSGLCGPRLVVGTMGGQLALDWSSAETLDASSAFSDAAQGNDPAAVEGGRTASVVVMGKLRIFEGDINEDINLLERGREREKYTEAAVGVYHHLNQMKCPSAGSKNTF